MTPAATSKRRVIPWIEGALLLLFLFLPLAVDDFWVLFFTRVFILGLLALSFDLVWGYAGILSFGQALFFGVAGYSCALLATKAGVTSILLLLPLAAVVGLVVSVALAFLIILGKRVPTSVFVALGTLTGSYVVERLARGWSYVGGQNGIPSLPRLTIFGHEIAEGPVYYYFALAILALIYLGLRWLTRSQFGLVLAGIREQEARIAFFGYQVQNYKGVVFAIAGYNRLVGLTQRSAEAWSDMDVQLKRRTDLVPNLVETVKGYAAHERGTFDAVVRARGAAVTAATPDARARAEGQLSDALRQLFALAESYPELKASQNFQSLQDSLAEIEDSIQNSRRYYNAVVRDLNTAVDTFPSNFIASSFRFEKRGYFELDRPEDRQAPRVSFGS